MLFSSSSSSPLVIVHMVVVVSSTPSIRLVCRLAAVLIPIVTDLAKGTKADKTEAGSGRIRTRA